MGTRQNHIERGSQSRDPNWTPEIRPRCRSKKLEQWCGTGKECFSMQHFFPDGCLNKFWLWFHVLLFSILDGWWSTVTQCGMAWTCKIQQYFKEPGSVREHYLATWLLVLSKHPFGTGSKFRKGSPTFGYLDFELCPVNVWPILALFSVSDEVVWCKPC